MLIEDPAQRLRTAQSSERFHPAVLGFSKPLIAAVDGYALGTGFDFALMCDTRICTERAQFGHPEVRTGGVPPCSLRSRTSSAPGGLANCA